MKDDPDENDCIKKLDNKYEKKILKILNSPLCVIKIAKKMSSEELANIFGITYGHMKDIEQGNKFLKETKLIKGLDKLGIDYNKYLEYQLFLEKLVDSSISIEKKLSIALGRALGLTYIKTYKEFESSYSVLQKQKMII